MPYVKIYLHTVWTTKSRQKLMAKEIRQQIFDHILENAKKKGIHIIEINGYLEHVHCIISLKQDQNISTVKNLIKGESSYWIKIKISLSTQNSGGRMSILQYQSVNLSCQM
ncbi:MAG: transposase [Bacteroidales bacterium]|nr:transposase [Bacteroidales bacterium]MCF8328393.1 transposase [Bacteroidales bacterium]